jgi:hypothetical protein
MFRIRYPSRVERGTDMQDQDCVTTAKALKARAAKLLTQARETNDPWFVEQLSRLAEDLDEYADALETQAARDFGVSGVLAVPPVRG